ncbi:MAG: peptidase E [Chloroflexi bacterium]|nr:peptidase E [Chloroflexota bacterium]
MGKIVAIGGGSMEDRETLAIDREVVRLTGLRRPRALFIPTASYDNPERYDIFKDVYGGELGCDTDVLNLLGVNPTGKELEEKILSSDLIYVSGGNTLKLMRRWRRLGVDRILRTAHDRGIVLAGLSAGAICWFKYGHSDSMSFYGREDWSYVRVKGMGLINALGVAHYHAEGREEDFHRMVAKHPEVGIAIDNGCALEVVDGAYRLITSQPGAHAYRVSTRRGEVDVQRLEQTDKFRPMAELLGRGH